MFFCIKMFLQNLLKTKKVSLFYRQPPATALDQLTIRPAACKGYGSIAHEAKPNGLLTRVP